MKPFAAAFAAVALLCLAFALPPARAAETQLQTVDGIGYQINLGSNNKISLSRVAAVPLGKLCVASMSVTDPYRTVYVLADRNWATMDPNPAKPGTVFARPRQVWAKCEVATCTAPKPADEERPGQCPTGTTGVWTQKLTYASAPYPTCWSPGNWTPDAPPADACKAIVTTMQVYACPEADADGRILESSSVTWPNCPSASYQTPSRALVVAVNPGSQPRYWRDASTLTTEWVWTQTGGVGAWVRANAIDWGVAQSPGTGTANLTWTPPTENTDGTALTDLAGYRIIYGTSASALSQMIQVPASVTSYVIEQLSPATYYFAVRSYNAAGVESANSNIASKALP